MADEKKTVEVKKTDKISMEVAEMEFQKFVDAMDLDIDPEGMSDEDQEGLKSQQRIFCRAVRNGSLSVNDNGEPVFKPQRSINVDPITFYEPDGAVVSAIDMARASAEVSKAYKMLGALTHTTAKRFSNMKYPDLKVCTAIMTLFMG